MTDNSFYGKVPSKIIIGTVSNAVYSGDYKNIYDIQSFISGNVMTPSPYRDIRLNVRFAEALKETINIIVYAKFSEVVKIDHTKNVTLT